jgi:hypothetical protein
MGEVMGRDIGCFARFLKNSAASLLALDFKSVREELLLMRLQLVFKLEPVDVNDEGV